MGNYVHVSVKKLEKNNIVPYFSNNLTFWTFWTTNIILHSFEYFRILFSPIEFWTSKTKKRQTLYVTDFIFFKGKAEP